VAAPDIDRPIFIIAPHRSGTTVLYNMMGRHPEVGYLNLANRRFPNAPRLARLLTRLGMSDRPRETERFWDRLWCTDDDVMTSEQATPDVVAWYRRYVALVLRLRGVTRFLAKYPRLSLRMGWLDAAFPGARFIHLVRDWRAVVNSTLNRRTHRDQRSGKWYGMRIPGWRDMADVPWEIVAGRQYRVATRAIEEYAPACGDRFLTIRYTQLCGDPVATLHTVVDHCELSWTEDFQAGIRSDLRSANYKWRERLDPECIERIRAEAPDFYAQHEEEG
jgi:hypothetical protein